MRDLQWASGASAHDDPPLDDVIALVRQFGPPIGYHAIVRDGELLGYAPDDDDCIYDIADIIPA